MHSLIEKFETELAAVKGESNLPAQHKAILDVGEHLLVVWSSFLFGEYKRGEDPLRPVEIGLFNASTRGVSLGQRWGFVRDLLNGMESSAFAKVFNKNVKHEAAGELVFWFKRLKTVCIENPEASERVNSGFRAVIESRCAGQRPTPVTKQAFFDEAFVPIRNIYAHPQQVIRKTGETINWPLNDDYFKLVNPLLAAALREVLSDVKAVFIDFRQADISLVDTADKEIEFKVDGQSMTINLEDFPDVDSADVLPILLTSSLEPYSRLYTNNLPSVAPSVREALVREETKRQSRAMLQRLIETLFSEGSTIDEPAYLNLRLAADSGGYTPDELDTMIGKHLEQLGRSPEYEISRQLVDSRPRWNQWWSWYFAYRGALRRSLVNDKNVLSTVSKGFLDDPSSVEFFHKRAWAELDAYFRALGAEVLDTEDTQWQFETNKWQIGKLSGYFWSRVSPAISPLGSAVGVSLHVSDDGVVVGLSQDRNRLLPLLQFEDSESSIYQFLYERVRHYMPLLAGNLDGVVLRFRDFSAMGPKNSGVAEIPYLHDLVLVGGEQLLAYSCVEYMERFPEPVDPHLVLEIRMEVAEEEPGAVDDQIRKGVLMFKQIVEDVTNFAIENGLSLERALAKQKRYPARRAGLLEELDSFASSSDWEEMSVGDRFESARRHAHRIGLLLEDFDGWAAGRFESSRPAVSDQDAQVLKELAPALSSAIKMKPIGLEWKFDSDRSLAQIETDPYYSAYARIGDRRAVVGIRLNQWGEWRGFAQFQGRRDYDDFREAAAAWLRVNESWKLLSLPDGTVDLEMNSGKTRCAINKDGPPIVLSAGETGEIQATIEELLVDLDQLLKRDDRFTGLSPAAPSPSKGLVAEFEDTSS